MGIMRHVIGMPLEYLFKLSSVPSGILALGSEGNVLEKMASGATKLVKLPGEIYNGFSNFSNFVKDYETLGEMEFMIKYGINAAGSLIDSAKGLLEYCVQFKENFENQPVGTLAAGFGITALLYGVGHAAKFCRQKGQGSWLQKLERRWGYSIWKDSYWMHDL